MRIDWRRLAYIDAIQIADYINIDNPVAALSVYEEINHQISLLADNPLMGRPGRVTGTRELVINRTPYIAVYLVSEIAVKILRILHGAQKWPIKIN